MLRTPHHPTRITTSYDPGAAAPSPRYRVARPAHRGVRRGVSGRCVCGGVYPGYLPCHLQNCPTWGAACRPTATSALRPPPLTGLADATIAGTACLSG
jgi:hypothetical protein